MPTRQVTTRRNPLILIGIWVFIMLLLALGGAYFAGAFDRFFTPAPYRDPLLDTFEQRTVPSSERPSESSFRVGESGTVPPRSIATSTATSTNEIDPTDDTSSVETGESIDSRNSTSTSEASE